VRISSLLAADPATSWGWLHPSGCRPRIGGVDRIGGADWIVPHRQAYPNEQTSIAEGCSSGDRWGR
jgi:hypothetical protein